MADLAGKGVLLTGATGYVGGKLLPLLETQDARLRCLARSPDKLRTLCAAGTEIVAGDLLDEASLVKAMEGMQLAYYLVHAMGSAGDFAERERQAARNFVSAGKRAGLERIIYLGGLGDESVELSPHLRSRQETGQILREAGIETIEFRSSVVIGSGSLSFDMVRALTEKLPVMICPRWVSTATQPIAIADVLAYLQAAGSAPPGESRIYEIGGADVVSYAELIREYARQRGLTRYLIKVPVLTPYLSSLWLGLVTPATAEVGRHLIEGVRNPTVVRDRRARKDFPDLRPVGIAEAVRAALTP